MTAIKVAHRTKRQADSLGTVAYVSSWHGNTLNAGFNGVNGRGGQGWLRQVVSLPNLMRQCRRGARRGGIGDWEEGGADAS